MELKDMKIILAILSGETVDEKDKQAITEKVAILVEQGTLQDEYMAKMNELRNKFDEIK